MALIAQLVAIFAASKPRFSYKPRVSATLRKWVNPKTLTWVAITPELALATSAGSIREMAHDPQLPIGAVFPSFLGRVPFQAQPTQKRNPLFLKAAIPKPWVIPY